MFIAVIGAGSVGKRHHDNLQRLGAKSLLLPWREFDAAAFRALGVTGAVIATATPVRLDPVRLCADLGLPVYVEKPLAFAPDVVDAIIAALGPLAGRSMVGFMMRYHPAVRHLAAADLSSVYDASFGIGHDVRLWRRGWRFAASYAARPEGGGVLLDLCHEIDLATLLLPQAAPASVTCLGHRGFPGVDFATRVALAGASVTGSVAMDYLSPVSYRRIVLRGTELVAEFDLIAQRYRIDDGGGARVLSLPFERNDMFLGAMRDFLHLVAGKAVDTPLLPRLDLVAESSRRIARAWAGRQFVGQIGGDYA